VKCQGRSERVASDGAARLRKHLLTDNGRARPKASRRTVAATYGVLMYLPACTVGWVVEPPAQAMAWQGRRLDQGKAGVCEGHIGDISQAQCGQEVPESDSSTAVIPETKKEGNKGTLGNQVFGRASTIRLGLRRQGGPGLQHQDKGFPAPASRPP
jgi:hypothetical protein